MNIHEKFVDFQAESGMLRGAIDMGQSKKNSVPTKKRHAISDDERDVSSKKITHSRQIANIAKAGTTGPRGTRVSSEVVAAEAAADEELFEDDDHEEELDVMDDDEAIGMRIQEGEKSKKGGKPHKMRAKVGFLSFAIVFVNLCTKSYQGQEKAQSHICCLGHVREK